MDNHMKKLARQLQREGIAPERDLWPGIEKALDQPGPAVKPGKQADGHAWFRMVAVAATLVLLVGSGYFGGVPKKSEQGQQVPLLQSLNNTISDLDAAMAQDPDNIKLTRLSLMTHKSRANLLRVGTRR